ncbi:NAD-dependent protein deacetylase [Venenivibrio stagnispumantis]|nr:Sir2 family NAD-dependent protein deacetylase [Venenivibrio stagnispumantis]MCW4573243.1 NAD-dependent deacetylase [Venenivibrio stagnispumantis]
MMEFIEKAKEAIKKADVILITAGAGMSVDSGLPDFRGKEGFWRAYPYAKKLGVSFEELANPKWFIQNPEIAWAFYGHRYLMYKNTQPHEGYKLLLNLAKSKKGYYVYTSNVDGHFEKAGFENIVEIHGSINHLQCIYPCTDEIWEAKDLDIKIDMENFRALTIPRCKNCGAVARPNILMFGDFSWIPDRTEYQEYRFNLWLDKVENFGYKMVIIEIGAGKAIPTIRWFSENISYKYNATLIRINPIDYEVPSKKDISIPMKGLEAIRLVTG